MKKLWLFLTAATLSLLWVQSPSSLELSNLPAEPSYGDEFWKDIIPGEMIIGYDNNIDVHKASPEELGIADKGVTILNKSVSPLNFIVVNVPGDIEAMKNFVKLMEKENGVKYVEPNRWMHLHFTPNDPYYSQQYDKPQMNCELAWDLGLGNMGISVAVVDQGTQYTHPDLVAHYGSYKGYDFYDGDPDPMPGSASENHGTHCSGIAGAVINNGVGIAGVANVTLYSYRCGRSSILNGAACANSIQECANNGVNVISMSWGGGYSSPIHNAIQNAWSAGCLMFSSSGNSGGSGIGYPAAHDEVIAGH